jgi:hypothetical protein
MSHPYLELFRSRTSRQLEEIGKPVEFSIPITQVHDVHEEDDISEFRNSSQPSYF